ncbi:MAG: PhnD/SsuA/transferrin family substrate-binding protein, partial [Planctomycetota bacterium]
MLSARKAGAAVLAVFASSAVAAEPLRLVVMDPLSKPLSCPCVEGYAQRDYAALAEFLEERLGREVTVAWNGSLVSATEQAGRPADVAIGKHSVVAADAVRVGRAMSPVASLTGQDGAVTQRGLIVVRTGDAATELADLAGYRVFFGPEDEAEKSAAAVRLLATAGIDPPAEPERFGACSEAAVKLLKQPGGTDACAVISSYAAPLLEGCGSVKKGDLRVLAETDEVPFVTAFVADDLDPELRDAVTEALLETATRAELLVALETLIGFVPFEPVPTTGDSSADAGTGPDAEKADRQVSTLGPESWPQFRGPNRDGVVPGLPDRLPRADEAVWEVELPGEGLGGLAVADGVLVLGGRDATDRDDLFRAYDAATGFLLWEHAYRAEGRLDYGNAPRATPLIESGLVVTVGAFGRVCCLDLVTGVPLWERDLVADFGGSMPAWGYSASPLLTGTAVVVEPGHPDAAVVALDLVTGSEVWRSPGGKAVYTSPLVLTAGGDTRIFGRDGVGPVGRDPATGRA